MRIEYDPARDLLYFYFSKSKKKAVNTVTVMPGVFADFDNDGRIIGLEIIDASEIIGRQIEFKLPEVITSRR